MLAFVQTNCFFFRINPNPYKGLNKHEYDKCYYSIVSKDNKDRLNLNRKSGLDCRKKVPLLH